MVLEIRGGSSDGFRVRPLTTDASLFACFRQETLREIESFLRLCQVLLQALDAMFQHLEPLSDIGGQRTRTRGPQTDNLDHHAGNDAHRREERDWSDDVTWIHVTVPVKR